MLTPRERTNHNSPDKLKRQEYLIDLFQLTLKRYKEVYYEVLDNRVESYKEIRDLTNLLRNIEIELNLTSQQGLDLDYIDYLNDNISEYDYQIILQFTKYLYGLELS